MTKIIITEEKSPKDAKSELDEHLSKQGAILDTITYSQIIYCIDYFFERLEIAQRHNTKIEIRKNFEISKSKISICLKHPRKQNIICRMKNYLVTK